jgi:aspartyl-tRNA(Asn)/glutamyl-tRNA(Gln) amidotransferase subunit A
MKIDLNTLTIKKARAAFINGDYSAVDLAKAYLSEIEKKNKELNAYVEVYSDVLEQAAEADKKIKSGEAGLLTGIPFALKDNILIKGKHASSCSNILKKEKVLEFDL